jgi:tRNA A37 N6-isopentenylltransferase MiaA
MSGLTGPPRYVPTLTEVVRPARAPEASVGEDVEPMTASVDPQELMMQQVLQRLDLMLEQHLPETIEQLILEHTHAMMPRLREAIELAVRKSVTQAFEDGAT